MHLVNVQVGSIVPTTLLLVVFVSVPQTLLLLFLFFCLFPLLLGSAVLPPELVVDERAGDVVARECQPQHVPIADLQRGLRAQEDLARARGLQCSAWRVLQRHGLPCEQILPDPPPFANLERVQRVEGDEHRRRRHPRSRPRTEGPRAVRKGAGRAGATLQLGASCP